MTLRDMKTLLIQTVLLVAGLAGSSQGMAADTETLVFIRHGEKPPEGLGQISCQGLNRALALPKVLVSQFGKPAAIFAPDPGMAQVHDRGGHFHYVRPLATIEPTAIQLGMPVITRYGFTDIDGMTRTLLSPDLQNATVFIAWEHMKIVDMVKNIFRQLEIAATVPGWADSDYDSIYVVTLTTGPDGKKTGHFAQQRQNLDNRSPLCPEAR